jgi:hypothetical protein
MIAIVTEKGIPRVISGIKAAWQLDSGLGVPIEQARGMMRRWASK